MDFLNRVHARSLLAWGQAHPEAIVLSGDLTASCEADEFREACPDQFVSMGLAEQNMMSFAAGLAREGLRPLVHTFSVFIYRRALDQIEMSIAYPNLPVRIFGFLPGVTTPGLGPPPGGAAGGWSQPPGNQRYRGPAVAAEHDNP